MNFCSPKSLGAICFRCFRGLEINNFAAEDVERAFIYTRRSVCRAVCPVHIYLLWP